MAELLWDYRKRLAVQLLRQQHAKGVVGLTAGDVAGMLGTPHIKTRHMLTTGREFRRVAGTGTTREPYLYGLAEGV